MKLPDTGKKKALIIVDMQPAFISQENSFVVPKVKSLIDKVQYDAYVEAVFSADKGSVWDIQKDWIYPEGEDTRTVEPIAGVLQDKSPLRVHKQTHSVFAGDKDVATYLKERNIEEVHLVGLETDDCVLATAFGAFDSGFIVYVLEECCAAATNGRHQMGLDILRVQGITNNRCAANTVNIDL